MALADLVQMGERPPCKQHVTGSSPVVGLPGGIAQLAERMAVNHDAIGSNPIASAAGIHHSQPEQAKSGMDACKKQQNVSFV